MRRALGLANVAIPAGFLAAWAATPLPRDVRVALIDLGLLAAPALAGAAALWARRRPEHAETRASLGLLAAGALIWAAGQGVWTYQEVVLGIDSPMFHIADAGFLLSLPVVTAAVWRWPRERLEWRQETFLDFSLIVGVAAVFGLEFVLGPLLDAELTGPAVVYAVGYPLAELLLFSTLVAALLLGCWRQKRRLELVALGLLAIVVADTGFTYLGQAYATGSIFDPLWPIGFAVVGLAALASRGVDAGRGWVSERAVAVAPSAAVFVIAAVGVAAALSGRAPLGGHHRAAILALVMLLAARQAYTQLRLLAQAEEQRRLEQQLQHGQKLEAIGRLAGGVAHDFNNLLTAIDGYSDLALHQLAGEHPARRDIEEVRRAAKRAADLTRQLLAFSRRQVLVPQVVDLNAVVTDAERLLRRLAGEDVVLVTALAPRPALVLADPGQLEQVITNLVVNARDAMPDGGTVTIATVAENGHVRLSVADTGVGMTDEVRTRLFEPFFTTKETGKGTGLGLAMVHGILAQSDGRITVTSGPGLGSRFDIELPAAAAHAGDSGEAPVATPSNGSETVLLVEDEDAVRDIARRMLELAGYGVVGAASGEEALELAEGLGRLDVLVTDVVMPGMNGHELASRLRQARPELAVVLMSGFSQDAEALDRLRAAGAAFVEKPFTSSALVSEVRGVLDAAVAL